MGRDTTAADGDGDDDEHPDTQPRANPTAYFLTC